MDIETGKDYSIKFPFILVNTTALSLGEVDPDEEWRPGCRSVLSAFDDGHFVADAEGELRLSVVDIHKPGRFPTRVFYTREWTNPDGEKFGSGRLHITTTATFKRRATGYYYEYELAQ